MKLPWPALVLSILVGLLTNRAQTADSLVLQGRALLSAKDLPNANARFLTSVELSPTHQTANVLYAATRVLAWPYSRPAQNMMDRLGMTQTNRDLYLWTAKIPHDTNGVPIPPNDLSSGEVLDLVRTNLLTELSGALGNLAKVTDTNFLLNLTSNETKMGDVTLDFGDVQILRALLHAGEFFIYSIHSYDLNAQFNALYSMHQRGELTIDQLLANYPRALTYATTNDLSLASNAFGNAVQTYLAGSEFIRSRPTNIVRLFNYDADMAKDEARFRQTLVELRASFTAPVRSTQLTNDAGSMVLNLGRAYDGTMVLRSLLPTFHAGGILLGSLPDPTFNGVISGLSESDFYAALGANAKLFPSFRTLQQLPDGELQFDVHAANGRLYAIETSSNLVTWTEIDTVVGEQGLVRFVDSALGGPLRAFYRVRDLSDAISFEGEVLDARTGKPLAGVEVSSTIDNQTATTDESGRFLLITRRTANFIGFFSLTCRATGYTSQPFSQFFSGGRHATDIVLWMINPVAAN